MLRKKLKLAFLIAMIIGGFPLAAADAVQYTIDEQPLKITIRFAFTLSVSTAAKHSLARELQKVTHGCYVGMNNGEGLRFITIVHLGSPSTDIRFIIDAIARRLKIQLVPAPSRAGQTAAPETLGAAYVSRIKKKARSFRRSKTS